MAETVIVTIGSAFAEKLGVGNHGTTTIRQRWERISARPTQIHYSRAGCDSFTLFLYHVFMRRMFVLP